MVLQTPVCTLRPWRAEDIAPLTRIADDRRIARNLTHYFPSPYSEDDAREWITDCQNGIEPYCWAIEAEGLLVGGLGIHAETGVFAHCAEIGYWLTPSAWGRGIASAAVAAATAYAFAELPFARLEAGVYGWNPASMRVLEKNGYQREGCLRGGILRFGEITDSILYARLRDE